MTDCTHNDKRTCFHERMEMADKILRLETENADLVRRLNGVTGILERWYVEHLEGGYARFHGKVYGDSKGRFADGDHIQTSKFTLDRHPNEYKKGDIVKTTFSAYELGERRIIATVASR